MTPCWALLRFIIFPFLELQNKYAYIKYKCYTCFIDFFYNLCVCLTHNSSSSPPVFVYAISVCVWVC